MSSGLEKNCRLCNCIKQAYEFYPDPSKLTGLSTYCRGCTKLAVGKRYEKKGRVVLTDEERLAKRTATKKKYRDGNRHKLQIAAQIYNNSSIGKARAKTRRETHKNEDRVNKAIWYEKNKEIVSEKARKNYEKNAATRKQAVKDRRKNNPNKVNAEKAVYKARKRAAAHNLSRQENKAIQVLYDYANEKGYHVDHIIPLKKGGLHCLGNLQVISETLNLNKHIKIGRFTDHPQGICCLPFFEGVKEVHIKKILESK